MTDPQDLDLHRLDDAARRAASGLRGHVLPRVDAEQSLARVPASSPLLQRGRFLAAAAAVVVLVGSVTVLSDRPSDRDSRLEVDEDGNKLPTPQPGTLTPLGPHDGLDSIQLLLTVVPATGLHDGDTVTVSAPGFVPGESVGLVQCAQEAGGETRDQRGGIDACDISPFTSITADSEGVATGDYKVQRYLTTPLTGTVDCSTAAERCLVALGALSDYDRSGGFGIEFAPRADGEAPPPDVPTLVVTPADGLSDGDIVHVEGEGYDPGEATTVQVCAKDPAACWGTGEDLDQPDDQCVNCYVLGLEADQSGRIEGDVAVWRFLPGALPGSYVDCAVSACTLRVSGPADGAAAAPATLGFVGGGEGPVPPAVAVTPTHDLQGGDTLIVRGAGFPAHRPFSVYICIGPADDPVSTFACQSDVNEERLADSDGAFAVEFRLPNPKGFQAEANGSVTTICEAGTTCPAPGDVPTVWSIRVESYDQGMGGPPQFPPAPVEITFRS